MRILVGTDAGVPFVFKGSGVHDEMAELVRAGLSPGAALKAATLDAAEFLDRTGDFGTIETGKIADLVLLDADPLADIRNAQRISAVLLNGRYLDRSALDQLLAASVEAVARAPGG